MCSFGRGCFRVLTVFIALAAGSLQGAWWRGSAEADLHRAASVALSNAVAVTIYPKVGLAEPLINDVEGERCPNCGRFHRSSLREEVKRETGVQTVGFLLASNRVVCLDPSFALENIGSIAVVAGGRSASAKVEKRFCEQDALLLALDPPLVPGDVVGIDSCADKPVLAVTVKRQARDNRALLASPKPLRAAQMFGARGDAWVPLDVPAVLLDARGRICGYTFNSEWRAGDATDPIRWPAYSVQELDQRLADAARQCAASVLPVTLTYRSPRMSRGGDQTMFRERSMRGSDGENETATELNTVGVLISDRRLFIRIGGDKSKLLRLEHIRVFLPGGPAEASFVCALASFKGVIAELAEPHPGQVLRIRSDPIGRPSGRIAFLCCADVASRGSLHFRSAAVRVNAVAVGWRGCLTTDLPVDRDEGCLVFSPDGVCQWWKASVIVGDDSIGESGRRWRNESMSDFLDASTLIALAQPADRDVDAAVRPVSPENENRLGWLGMDLQPITPELAESKKVMADTEGGKFGAIIMRVYPHSPAAGAGVKEGWVVVSVSPANRTLPLKVELEEIDSPYRSDFPWDRLDAIPAQYMDRLPTPWPSASNPFAVELTKLGIGTKVTAVFLADGAKIEKTMVIALAPPSYESTPSFKWKAGGISVCDLTQEVRDYLNLAPDAPGVVVCRVVSGGKAVTAGIRPFELIVRFNGKPVSSAKEFEALSRDATDIRLDVKRMTKERLVSFSVSKESEAATR